MTAGRGGAARAAWDGFVKTNSLLRHAPAVDQQAHFWCGFLARGICGGAVKCG
jgi:hypothetical protein